MKLFLLGAAILWGSLSAQSVSATPVTILFSGVITNSSEMPEIAVGTAFTGRATYNTSQSWMDCGSLCNGQLAYLSAPGDGLTLDIGQYEFSAIGLPNTLIAQLSFIPELGFGNAMGTGGSTNVPIAPGELAYFVASLRGTQGFLPTGPNLPIPDASRFTPLGSGISVCILPSDSIDCAEILNGDIESMTVVATPEPRYMMLAGIALVLVIPLFSRDGGRTLVGGTNELWASVAGETIKETSTGSIRGRTRGEMGSGAHILL